MASKTSIRDWIWNTQEPLAQVKKERSMIRPTADKIYEQTGIGVRPYICGSSQEATHRITQQNRTSDDVNPKTDVM